MVSKLAAAVIGDAYRDLHSKMPQEIRESALFFRDDSHDSMLSFWLGAVTGDNPAGSARLAMCKTFGDNAMASITKADKATKELGKTAAYKAAKHKAKGAMKNKLWIEVYNKSNKNPKIWRDDNGMPILAGMERNMTVKPKQTRFSVLDRYLTVRKGGVINKCRFDGLKFISTKAMLKFCTKRQEKYECEGCPCGHEILAGRRTRLPFNLGIVKI